MSFTLRPFASAALLLSMAGLCAGTLLAAEQTEPSEASAVRARPLVLGVVETAEPSFDDNTVRPVLKAMQSAAPGSVLSGHFDAGVVPVCTLERIEAEDLIERGALRVISPKSDDDTVCAHTSELYPDLVAATFSWTDPELTRLTTSALLASKSADAEFNWYGTSDFHRIRALEETLQIGPWAYLQEMTPEALWRRWRFALFAVLAGLGLLLLNEWRLRRLVAKRTGELKRSMEERDRLAQRERAVINYVAVVKLKLGLQTVPGLPGETALNTSERPVDPLLLRALAGAEGEAHRIAAIVDRVRSYARRQHADPVPVDIVREAQNALRSLKAELRPFVVIRPPFSLSADDASKRRLIMRSDPLEIELLLLNVMKNAAEAVQGLPDGGVLVKFRRETLPSPLAENPSPSPAAPSAEAVIVEVEDNGPRLSDEAFERLTRVSQSVKDEGLGLGLGIVRSLVEENGGRIAITRREDLSGRGLRVTLCFDLDAEGLKAQSAPETDPADKSAAQGSPNV